MGNAYLSRQVNTVSKVSVKGFTDLANVGTEAAPNHSSYSDICITKIGTDGTCGAAITYAKGAFKYSIFGVRLGTAPTTDDAVKYLGFRYLFHFNFAAGVTPELKVNGATVASNGS